METKIRRWGNSLGLRIPKSFAEEAGVDAGSTVDISVRGGALVARPLRPRRYDLRSLVKMIDEDNIPEPVETGPPVGREVW